MYHYHIANMIDSDTYYWHAAWFDASSVTVFFWSCLPVAVILTSWYNLVTKPYRLTLRLREPKQLGLGYQSPEYRHLKYGFVCSCLSVRKTVVHTVTMLIVRKTVRKCFRGFSR